MPWLRRRLRVAATPLPDRRLRRRLRASNRTRQEAPPASDNVVLAFAQLCRDLGRPFPPAEIRAAAPAADHAMAVGNVLLAAERLGFKARALKPTGHNLANAPAPFLVVGRAPGEAWVARERVRDHLVLVAPGSGVTTACGVDAVADLADRIVLAKPLMEPAAQDGWRDTMLRRLRPVLWELGIASVVINLLALATPIFLMTVYNTDGHRTGAS